MESFHRLLDRLDLLIAGLSGVIVASWRHKDDLTDWRAWMIFLITGVACALYLTGMVSPYRDLTQSEIDGINSIKALEADAAQLVKQLKAIPEVDQRAMALAVTNLQQACMWMTKGVARSADPFA